MADEKQNLLLRNKQLMEVLYGGRRLPDPELDQDIALVAHVMGHAEIAAQQLTVARMALGGIIRNAYANNAEVAKAVLETMDELEKKVTSCDKAHVSEPPRV